VGLGLGIGSVSNWIMEFLWLSEGRGGFGMDVRLSWIESSWWIDGSAL
jgi:hypothetical protein